MSSCGPAFFSPGSSVSAGALAFYNAVINGGKGAYWEFEENSAATAFADDSGNGNALTCRDGASIVATSTNTTSSSVIGRAFYMGATTVTNRTAYIPRANTNLDLPNADFFFGGWALRVQSASGTTRFMMGRQGSGSGQAQALLLQSGSLADIRFAVSSDGSTTAVEVIAPTTPSPNSVALIACSLDRTNNLIRIRVKANSQTSPPTSAIDTDTTTAFPGALFTTASTANFCISSSLSGDSTFVSGGRQMVTDTCFDQAFYGTGTPMTEAMFLYLFNAGAGRTWAAIAADAGH